MNGTKHFRRGRSEDNIQWGKDYNPKGMQKPSIYIFLPLFCKDTVASNSENSDDESDEESLFEQEKWVKEAFKGLNDTNWSYLSGPNRTIFSSKSTIGDIFDRIWKDISESILLTTTNRRESDEMTLGDQFILGKSFSHWIGTKSYNRKLLQKKIQMEFLAPLGCHSILQRKDGIERTPLSI